MPLIHQLERAAPLVGGTVLAKSGARLWNFGSPVFDSNSYTGATSSVNDLIDEAVQGSAGIFAPLAAFTTLRDAYYYDPAAPHIFKISTSGGVAQLNPTNWQIGDGNVSAGTATMQQFSASVHVTNTELNSGLRITDLLPKLFTTLATSLTSSGLFGQITTGNFPAAPIVSATASFGLSESASAFATIPNSIEKFLILNPTLFANLNANAASRGFQSGEAALGWDGIFQNSVGWASASAKCVGFGAGREALVVVTGRPALPAALPGNLLARKLIELPNGFVVELNTWLSTSDRSYWMSADVVAGFGVGDSSALVLIQTP